MSKKILDKKVVDNTLGVTSSPEITIDDDQSIEVPTQELSKAVEMEKFMAEYVVVEVQDTTDENQPPSLILSVNGITQPVFRGQPTRMRRMFLEVLARCKETKHNQRTVNPNQPDKIELQSRTALAYPFQVLEDPNPKGRAWLRAVLMEAA